jgi:hypothetical protein
MHCLDLIFAWVDFSPSQTNLYITLSMDCNNDLEQLAILAIQCVLFIQMDLFNDVK